MKNTYILGLCASLVGASVQASTLVNFDDPSIGTLTPVTTQYAAEGVTFSGVDSSGNSVALDAANNTLYNDVNPTSAPNALSDFYNGDPTQRAALMQINFTSGATGISFEYNPAGSAGVDTVFNVYGPSGLVDSFSDPNAGVDGVFYLETIPSTLGVVDEVDIVTPVAGWGHYIDDLSFTGATASAPDGGATAGLLGIAFAGIAGLRRKLNK